MRRRRIRWGIGLIAYSLYYSLLSHAWGQAVVVADFSTMRGSVADEWEVSVHKGEAQVKLVQDGEKQALHMRSDKASFALQKKVQVALKETPFLVWQWKVTNIPPNGDFRNAKVDDQAAQLIVAFSSSRFITYIWDSLAPKGTLAETSAPPFKKLFAAVVQSGSQGLGTWITERRNLIEDYRQAFGGETPESIEGVRIQINSQHTQSLAESYWRSILVTAKP